VNARFKLQKIIGIRSAFQKSSPKSTGTPSAFQKSSPKIAPSPYAFQKARVVNLSIVNLKLGIANIERGSLPPFQLP
jgi:hypothetical protein